MADKRILFVFSACTSGGIECTTKDRMVALNKRGYQTKILFYRSGAGLINYNNIPHIVSSNKQVIIDDIKKNKYDIIDFINELPDEEVIIKSGFKGIVLFELGGRRKYNKKLARDILNRLVDAIFVASNFTKQFLIDEISPSKPIYIIPRMVDTTLFNTISGEEYHKLTNTKNKKKIIGWVGRLGNNKNWKMYLAFLYSLTKHYKNQYEGWVIGDLTESPDVEIFKERVQELNLQEHIRIFDSVPHTLMPVFYNDMAKSGGCLLSTSRYEGYHMVLVEAMACKCPVVASKSGGPLDIIDHEKNGYLYELSEWTRGIEYVKIVTQNEEVRKRFIEEAYKKVLIVNSENKVIGDFVRIIEEYIRT